jgi:hypothetical protein
VAQVLEITASAAYVHGVRRILKPLVALVVALQLLVTLPALAMAAGQGAEPACAGMAEAAHTDDCPCCPEGTTSMADCLASCLLAAVASVHLASTSAAPAHSPPVRPSPSIYSSAADPPLKPPPIA